MKAKKIIPFICLSAALAATPKAAQAQTDAPLNPGFDIDMLINPATCGLYAETWDPLGEGNVSPSVWRESGLGNPELARGGSGAFDGMSHTVQLNYKNQINGAFSGGSLRIISAGYQCRFFRERMALGATVYSNTLNARAMQDFEFMLNYAYHWNITEDERGNPLHRLSFGLQAGYRRYGYNIDAMVTGSMYDPAFTGGFNPALVDLDAMPHVRHMFDGNFGIQYTGVFGQWMRLELGAAVHHLFRPRTGLLEDDYRVPLRLSAHGRALMAVPNTRSEVGLQAYYTYHALGGANTLESVVYAGVSYRYKLQPGLSLGGALSFRTQATLIPQFFVDVSNFTLNFQVEFNTAYSYNNLFSIALAYRL